MRWIDPIVAVLVIAVLVGFLRGGRLANLAEINLRVWWLLLVGLAMQIVANLLPRPDEGVNPLAVALILLSYLPLIAVVILNRQSHGMWLAAIGILMNFSVIAANQGMPVSPEAAVIAGAESTDLDLDAKHVVLDEDSLLPFLADVMPLKVLGQVISLGDVFLAVGVGQFVESEMRRPVRYFRHGGRGQPGSAAPTP